MFRIVAETAIEVVTIPIMLGIVGVGLVFQALQGAKEGWNDGEGQQEGQQEGQPEAEGEAEERGAEPDRGHEGPETGTEEN